MRSFTSYLQKSTRPEWAEYYLDYLSLKSLLEQFAERRRDIDMTINTNKNNNTNMNMNLNDIERFYPEAESSNSFEMKNVKNNKNMFLGFGDFNLMSPNNSADDNSISYKKNDSVKNYMAKIERDEFCYVLDKEVRKITTLYHRQLTELKSDITLLENEVRNATANGNMMNENDVGEIQTFLNKYKVIGNEILELHAFVGANITALRQILIRYDSLIRTLDGPPLGEWYIVTRREVYVDDNFEAIFVRHGLLLLTDTFLFAMRNLQSIQGNLNTYNINRMNHDIDSYLENLQFEIAEMETVILRAERAVDKALRSRLALTDSIFKTLRYFFLVGSLMNELVMQPSFIRTRGLKLKDEIRFFSKWRTQQSLPVSDKDSKANIRDIMQASLVLNCFSQFLYMMNHYIIEPSSTQYVHALGGRDALSGLLIGMTPWAGLISAFVYSFWSNRCFKEPLICSGVCLTLGALLYANALKFESLTMAMIGRFLTGLGAPCGINVRFIADTVKKANRTAISAVLVTVSAMGMSLGPFFAVLLDFLDLELDLPIIGEVTINGMTGPGYLMTVLWGIWLIFFLIYFKESERVGLMEIAQNSTSKDHYSAPNLNPTKSCESIDTYDGGTTIFSEDEGDNLEEEKESTRAATAFTVFRYINEATIVCMLIKFIGKFVLEIMGCSVSLITRHRYGWSVKNIGALSFVNGMLVIPISTSVGFLSQRYTDITLLLWLLGVTMVGLLLLVDFTDFGADENGEDQDGYNDELFFAVAPWRYILGIVLEFCGFQAAQSVILSMLSKVVPLSLARGTFNSGFMATTISTLARANGDMLITVMGLVSIRELLNLLVVPCILMTGFCIMLSVFHKHKLSV